MPPEFYLKNQFNIQSDWWTFGCILYEMAVGVSPFYSKDLKKMVAAIINQTPNVSVI